MNQPTFQQDFSTDAATIKSLEDVGERCEAARKKLYDGLDALAPGLIGAAGNAAQTFKTDINTGIEQINKVGDEVAEALRAATNQSSSDDADAAQDLNQQMSGMDQAKSLLSGGQA